jgi:hypothetical protein
LGCPRAPRLGPPGTGTGITAACTYDGLDRLLTADEGGHRTRYRYVGQTTAVAQTVNDVTGLPIRSIGTDRAGERLVDCEGLDRPSG